MSTRQLEPGEWVLVMCKAACGWEGTDLAVRSCPRCGSWNRVFVSNFPRNDAIVKQGIDMWRSGAFDAHVSPEDQGMME